MPPLFAGCAYYGVYNAERAVISRRRRWITSTGAVCLHSLSSRGFKFERLPLQADSADPAALVETGAKGIFPSSERLAYALQMRQDRRRLQFQRGGMLRRYAPELFAEKAGQAESGPFDSPQSSSQSQNSPTLSLPQPTQFAMTPEQRQTLGNQQLPLPFYPHMPFATEQAAQLGPSPFATYSEQQNQPQTIAPPSAMPPFVPSPTKP